MPQILYTTPQLQVLLSRLRHVTAAQQAKAIIMYEYTRLQRAQGY